MKLTTFVLGFSALSFVNSKAVAPTYIEHEADLVERDLNVPSLVADLLDGFDVADIISSIDFEKIAGWADDLLNTGDNIEVLDNILVGLKNSQILPNAAVYIVTHNTTLDILKQSFPTILSVAGQVNTTSLFVALDRSGLAYSVVAGAITDDAFLPSVLEIAKKLIESGGISLSSLLEQAGELFQRDLYEDFETGVESFPVIEKRDNIEDLLTTVFSSVERSGLVNDTVVSLLTNDEFQDATVVLIQGLLQNIGSIIKGTDFTALKPVLNSLLESGLLTHTLERALEDADLREALTSDLATLLKQGSIKKSDLVDESKAQSILAMDSLMQLTSSAVSSFSSTAASTSVSSKASASSAASSSDSSTTSSAASSTSASSSSTDMAGLVSASKLSVLAGLLLSLV